MHKFREINPVRADDARPYDSRIATINPGPNPAPSMVHRYSLYLETDLNRVYSGSLAGVAEAELRYVTDAALRGRVGPISVAEQGRSAVLGFEVDGDDEVHRRLVAVVGQLSASLALFRHERAGGNDLLRPMPLVEVLAHGSELVTTQRYRGKTNERFTRAMLNIALAVAGVPLAEPAGRLLDPMCGRGTTLNWALAYGLDATGIDVDDGALDQHRTFIEQWAKRSRLPHKTRPFRPGNAEQRHTTVTIATDRAALKAGGGRTIETFAADGGDRGVLTRRSVDLIVVDLPYGIQHRGSGGGPRNGRHPADETGELLDRLLPVWRTWLRPGGALCLAWNTRRLERFDASVLVVDAGLELVEPTEPCSLAHVVDATIDRDVLVAVN